MAYKAPGKHYRKGISVSEFFKIFPDHDAAEQWFIKERWPNGVACPYCGSLNVQIGTSRKRAPFRCREKECGKRFSVKIGTFMESSNIKYRDWLFAVYLVSTNLKGVSSMKLHRDLGVTQKTAWHLAHRIRRALRSGGFQFFGPVEADESYFGGKRRNMPKSKRTQLEGRGPVGKTAVVGVKDRATKKVQAQVVENTASDTLQGFVLDNIRPGAKVYTDDSTAYESLPNHESVRHSVAEYVRGQAHTNGIESFWSMLKRAHKGTFHRLSPKHLHRYVDEFVSRHNMRDLDTLDQMAALAQKMTGSQLRYKDLVG